MNEAMKTRDPFAAEKKELDRLLRKLDDAEREYNHRLCEDLRAADTEGRYRAAKYDAHLFALHRIDPLRQQIAYLKQRMPPYVEIRNGVRYMVEPWLIDA